MAEVNNIPNYGLKIKLNHIYPEKRDQNVRPKLSQIWPLIPLGLRYFIYYLKTRFIHGRRVIMDYINMEQGKQIYGVPIGGIGGGSIGRGFRGEFCRFQLVPGMYEYNTVDANQFIVNIRGPDGKTIFQTVLSTYSKPKVLKSWNWLLDDSKCSYTGLYPRAWTEYDLSNYGVKLTCQQVSPVIPHNYKDSSFPCAVFTWTVENVCDEKRTVSITFTFKNGTGTKKQDSSGNATTYSINHNDISGVGIDQTIKNMKCNYNLAASKLDPNVKLSICERFDPEGSGANLWNDLYRTGRLSDASCDTTLSSNNVAVGLNLQTSIAAHSKRDLTFALSWDMPIITFPNLTQSFKRYYTSFFGSDGTAGPLICEFALNGYKDWQNQIYDWQKLILEDTDLPDWYKSAIFNETYFISDGGTVWTINADETLDAGDPRITFGKFAYLEGHEYRMYNTYDVHFYASHALTKLWPNLQISLQYDFKDSINFEIKDKRKELYSGKTTERKQKNSIPHDLGDPDEDAFISINAYNIHDVSEWRDLNVKFILQVYRDYCMLKQLETKPEVTSGDILKQRNNYNLSVDALTYLSHMYQECTELITKCLRWDTDGDGLIENSNSPDQTYDSWVMKGASAYCGGLWLAALQCMVMMSDILDKQEDSEKYNKILLRGKNSFETKLWNGKYYRFDMSDKNKNTIMADQLCGQWYLRSAGFNYEVFPEFNVRTALKTIYSHNVLAFCNGKMGAVNGFIPSDIETEENNGTNGDIPRSVNSKSNKVAANTSPGAGKVDDVTIQSEEVWTGVTYGLAANMIYEGMIEEAFQTAGGMYTSISQQMGMNYETPEALYAEKHYRAIGYMRPLSIWSMQVAWENRKK